MSDYMSNEHEILQSVAKILHYLPLFFDDEVSVALTNREIFLVNLSPPSLPIKGGYGDKIPSGGIATAIETGQVTVREIPEAVYGVPFRSYPVPLHDEDGSVVGVLAIGRSLARSSQMKQMSQNLSDFLTQSVKTVRELSEDVQRLAVTNEDIAQKSKKAMSDTQGTAEVVKVIQNISLQTNLLGINAAIEAANSGQAGRGFRVVAEEIQRFSRTSTDSAQKIEGVLNDMTNSVEYISRKILSSNELFKNQSGILQDISKSLDELTTIAEQVRILADRL